MRYRFFLTKKSVFLVLFLLYYGVNVAVLDNGSLRQIRSYDIVKVFSLKGFVYFLFVNFSFS